MRDNKRMSAAYVDSPAGGGEGTAPKVTGGTGSPANRNGCQQMALKNYMIVRNDLTSCVAEGGRELEQQR